jgi:hypothetical protein
MRIGSEVPIARQPGKALLVRADLPGLKAYVLIDEKEVSIPLSDLFPQAGPFAPKHPPRDQGPEPRRRRDRHERHGRLRGPPEHEKKKEDKNQPMRRRAADSKAAQASIEALRKAQPGQQVYVVPFNKRATLVRLNLEQDTAVVQSGIFELEVPLSDLELLREGEK